MKCLALFNSPSVVCLELSELSGTMSFSFSRQFLRCARRFFSSSLWVDLNDEQIIIRKCDLGKNTILEINIFELIGVSKTVKISAKDCRNQLFCQCSSGGILAPL